MPKKIMAMSVDFSKLPDELSYLIFEMAGVDIPKLLLWELRLGLQVRPEISDVLFDLAQPLVDRLAQVYPCLSLYLVSTLLSYLNRCSDTDIEQSLRDRDLDGVFGALLMGRLQQLPTEVSGLSFLHLLARSGDGELLRVLLMAGADATMGIGQGPDRGQTVLHVAVRSEQLPIVDMILSVVDEPDRLLSCVDVAERSVFHWAVGLPKADILGCLLGYSLAPSLDINMGDETGFTVLHYAMCSQYGSVRMVQILISHGADISRVDQDGVSPLHLGVLRLGFSCG